MDLSRTTVFPKSDVLKLSLSFQIWLALFSNTIVRSCGFMRDEVQHSGAWRVEKCTWTSLAQFIKVSLGSHVVISSLCKIKQQACPPSYS